MLNPRELALEAARIIDGKKGENIIILQVDHLTSITDYFVIAGAKNALQVRAIAEEVDERMAERGEELRRREGYGDSRWIVLDYSSVIIHLFHVDEREYYNIERLWMDGSNQVLFETLDD